MYAHAAHIETVQTRGAARRGCRSARAFSLIDLLVSLAVVAVIIAITLPAIANVRESARQVVCASNLRQVGLSMTMYADDHRGVIPPSVFVAGGSNEGELQTVLVRIDRSRLTEAAARTRPASKPVWDGLGMLYARGYMSAPKVFYCPSHKGDHPFDRYAGVWEADAGEIVTNFQYRARGANGERRLDNMSPGTSLVTDSLRSLAELNHDAGFNALTAGLSVGWAPDGRGTIASFLSQQTSYEDTDGQSDIWRLVDEVRRGEDESPTTYSGGGSRSGG